MFFFYVCFPLEVCSRSSFSSLGAARADNTPRTHIHTHTHIHAHKDTHSTVSVFFCFVFFPLWSNCGCVLCWSNSQTTVAALFVPSLLCDRYEGSPLCDQKAFFFVVAQPLRTALCQSPRPGRNPASLGDKKKLPFLPSTFV